FFVSAPSVITAFTTGSTDTVGSILNARGEAIGANDDAQGDNANAGVTRVLPAGTYYFHVAHWDPVGTGSYTPVLRYDNVSTENYTSLWWNPAESGWGLNVNHQGNTLFAPLFTYGADGKARWFVMSDGNRSATSPNVFSGTLFQTQGPAFNTVPWTAVTPAPVGTMSLNFTHGNQATLTYTVNGVSVTKQIQ